VKKLGLSIFCGTLAFIGLQGALLHAGDTTTTTTVPKELAVDKDATAPDNRDWSLELGTGIQFSNVRESQLDDYTLVPAQLTAALKIDDVSLDDVFWGLLRGYTEFLFQGYGYAVPHGVESRILGVNIGPRYNFVQPGWKVVPYVEGLVGFGFADSSPYTDGSGPHGLGQDFNFTFGVGGGARYDINQDWFTRVGVNYTHFSNAGLSEPQFPNRAIDAFGPEISIGRRF